MDDGMPCRGAVGGGQGVVHNGLLLDHPQKSVVRAPFLMQPTPACQFERAPSWFKVPAVAITALEG
ncbi:MAG: hypothetical protein ACI8PZ_003181 [Myxococcota bacterium]